MTIIDSRQWFGAIIAWINVNSLRPRQNRGHFADDIFKCIFLNKNVWIAIKISLKFVPKGPVNNIPALVQIKAWRRPGDKPLSEAMLVSLPTHIYASLCPNELMLTKIPGAIWRHCASMTWDAMKMPSALPPRPIPTTPQPSIITTKPDNQINVHCFWNNYWSYGPNIV